MTLLAATSTTPVNFPTSLVTTLVQVGIVGLLLLDVLGTHKFVVPRWTLEAILRERDYREQLLQAQNERLEKEVVEYKAMVQEMQGVYQERMLPALLGSTEAQRSIVEVLGRMATTHGG